MRLKVVGFKVKSLKGLGGSGHSGIRDSGFRVLALKGRDSAPKV